MAEMIFLQCGNGSEEVRAACPGCGRISLQRLGAPYAGQLIVDLASPHTCPVCGEVYRVCSSIGSEKWESAFRRHGVNANAYNSAVKDNNARQKSASPEADSGSLNLPMDRWQELFTVTALKRGLQYLKASKLTDFVKTNDCVTAAIQGAELYRVRVLLNGRCITSVECNCPDARMGENCRHMAAVLFAADGRVLPERPKAEESALKAHAAQETEQFEAALADIRRSIEEKEKNTEHAPGDTALLERKIVRWKKELLDTGKRIG